jgi:hypothetical protein
VKNGRVPFEVPKGEYLIVYGPGGWIQLEDVDLITLEGKFKFKLSLPRPRRQPLAGASADVWPCLSPATKIRHFGLGKPHRDGEKCPKPGCVEGCIIVCNIARARSGKRGHKRASLSPSDYLFVNQSTSQHSLIGI